MCRVVLAGYLLAQQREVAGDRKAIWGLAQLSWIILNDVIEGQIVRVFDQLPPYLWDPPAVQMQVSTPLAADMHDLVLSRGPSTCNKYKTDSGHKVFEKCNFASASLVKSACDLS